MIATGYDGKKFKLVNKDGVEINKDDVLKSSLPKENYQLVDARAPHKFNSSGFVHVKVVLPNKKLGDLREFYTSVFNLKWVEITLESNILSNEYEINH